MNNPNITNQLIARCDRYIQLYKKHFINAGDPAEDRQYREVEDLRKLLQDGKKYTVNDRSFPRASAIKVEGDDRFFFLLNSEELDDLEKDYR